MLSDQQPRRQPSLAQVRALAAKLEAEDRRIREAKAKVAAGAPNMEIIWDRVRTPATRLIVAGLQQHRALATPHSRRAWKALCRRALRHGLLRPMAPVEPDAAVASDATGASGMRGARLSHEMWARVNALLADYNAATVVVTLIIGICAILVHAGVCHDER